jgi:hypothetical protein
MENLTMYKNKPLVKKGDTVYLGYTDEAFMIEMDILEKNADESASNVLVKLIDNSKAGRDRVTKKAERENLSRAMDIAAFWLLDALGEEA